MRDEELANKDKEALLVEIRRVHKASHDHYGSCKVNQEGIRCGRHRVTRLMRENNIVGLKAIRFNNHYFNI